MSEPRDGLKLAQATGLPWSTLLPGPITAYELVASDGRWGHEYLLLPQPLTTEGWRYVQTLGRSCNLTKPFIIVRHRDSGRGVAVMIAYGGNWVLEVQPAGDQVKVLARCSPANARQIGSLGELPVPGALVSEFTGDWDDATLPIRRYIRARLRRDLGPDWPPVQYNDWYFHSGAMSTESLLRCAAAAAEVGCEQFTVDAGWYGSRADWNYLGEWTVNRERFPNGFQAVPDGVRRLGLRFGMWVEIESVHPEAPIIREHPDWQLAGMTPTHRKVLDLGNPAAYAHVRGTLDRLITEYQLDYIKMDFNTDCSDGSERYADGRDPLLGHYTGLIELWRHLRGTYPKLIVENCGSGSLRQDAMTAGLTDTHWISDEIGNRLNLALNYGATLWFPAEIGSHWTTGPEDEAHLDWFDVQARFRANFTGHFGLSGDIAGWRPETRALLAREIAWYKQFRGHLCRSDVYHLTPPGTYDAPAVPTALQYLDPASGKSVVLAFRGHGGEALVVKPRELRPGQRYAVSGECQPRLDGGALHLRFERPGQSAIVELTPA